VSNTLWLIKGSKQALKNSPHLLDLLCSILFSAFMGWIHNKPNKLFKNMSTRMAESIKDDLEITTNVKLKDVEDAQQRIVDIIRQLEEKNEIVIAKGGKDDIIA